MTIYTIHVAKTRLSELIRRAEAGENVIIARGDTPVAVIKAYDRHDMAERRRKALGAWKGAFDHIPDSVWFDPLPDEELRLWEGHGPLITDELDNPPAKGAHRKSRKKP